MELSFTIGGRPKTWQRTVAHEGKRLSEKEQRAVKKIIGMRALAARPAGWPLDASYAMEVIGYWPDRRCGDADRLVSIVMDALEGVAYKADRQVRAQCSAVLLDRLVPRTEVLVVPYDEGVHVPVMTIELRRLSSVPALR
jgi:hypothetical protein